jgi:hypothetical protein
MTRGPGRSTSEVGGGLDPVELLQAAAAAALAAPHDRAVIDRWLDLEERVLYPVVERELADGDELMVDGFDHHLVILDVLDGRRRCDEAGFAALLESHAAWARDRVHPRLVELGEDRRRALGEALTEASASSEAADARLTAPLDRG